MSEEQIIDMQELLELLAKGKVQVGFIKLNGEVRDMLCTTNPALIPAEHQAHVGDGTRSYPLNAVPVYDLEVGGWRAFVKFNVFSYAEVF